MAHALFLLAVGLTVLVIGGRFVVDAASVVGTRLGLSPGLVGLTIVAAGTSAPELAVVLQALARDDEELAIGSIVGSNIANVWLVLGLASIIGVVTVGRRAARVDLPVLVGASVLTFLLAGDGTISQLDGVVLVSALLVFVAWSIRSGGLDELDDGRRPVSAGRLVRALVELVGGLVLLVVAARWAVRGAEEIARALGVSELVVGLTVLAIGTSLPEIITTIVAAVRGSSEMALGNAVGSNIFNLLLVLGVAGIVSGTGAAVSDDVARRAIPVMVGAAVLLAGIAITWRRVGRGSGLVLVGLYMGYLGALVGIEQ